MYLSALFNHFSMLSSCNLDMKSQEDRTSFKEQKYFTLCIYVIHFPIYYTGYVSESVNKNFNTKKWVSMQRHAMPITANHVILK